MSGNRFSAADLKFRGSIAASSFRNFKSKSGTRIIDLLVLLCFRSSYRRLLRCYHELRKRGTREDAG